MVDEISKTLFKFIIFLLIPINSSAQIKLDAQLRNRFEFREGYQKLAAAGSVPAVLVSQRTRLTFSYDTEQLKIKIAPQDVRLWGDDPNISGTGVGDNATIGLFEGYAELRLSNWGWLSAGRQQLIYDKEWIFSARNWNQNGIAYDAAVLKMKLCDWNLHFGSSWNTLKEGSSDNHYPPDRIKSLNYLWLNRKVAQFLNLSLLHVASGKTKSDTENKLFFRQTSGLFAEYKKGNFTVWGNSYYQYGLNQQGKRVSASLTDLDASYQLGSIRVGSGFAILSGNKFIGEGQAKDRLFDMLYGARHRYFGFLDYFSNFSTHTNQGGLADYFAYLDINISKNVNLKNISHYFRLDQTNPLTGGNKNLGFENDLVVVYKFSNWGTIESGFLFFLPTETLKAIQNVPDSKFSKFIYFQMTISPTMYKN